MNYTDYKDVYEDELAKDLAHPDATRTIPPRRRVHMHLYGSLQKTRCAKFHDRLGGRVRRGYLL